MKCFVLSVLLCAVALEATPYGIGGLGAGVGLGEGLGAGGLGVGGLGVGGLGVGGLGLGGMSSGHAGFANGGGFGGQQYNSGASGLGNQVYHNGGAGEFHNIGQHHNKLTSITQAEESAAHNIGASNAFNTGAVSGNGFNNYVNGASGYGNQFGHGGMGQQSIFG